MIAILAIFILPDFPTTTRWLTPLERKLALLRMEKDGGLNLSDQEETSAHSKQHSGLWQALSDWKVWWLAVALSSEVIALSFNAFFPTLTGTLNFNTTVTLILVAPPWFVAAIGAFLVARYN